MAWETGKHLRGSQYIIEKVLGQGGFGITYLAKDDRENRVVIKTPNDDLLDEPDFANFQEHFVREALSLAKCSHPHIVQIKDVFQERSLWCMVMEYIEGEDLDSWVRKQGALSESEALTYIQQIGAALTVVHKNNLLHRDVKPSNIMLRADKAEAVLIDFGIARNFTPNLTQTHTPLATDHFAPIEQYYTKAKRGSFTDVYALAATLYVLLTRELPPTALDRDYWIENFSQELLIPPQQLNPRISNRVNQAILKGMAIKPDDRPQSVRDWLRLFVRLFPNNIYPPSLSGAD